MINNNQFGFMSEITGMSRSAFQLYSQAIKAALKEEELSYENQFGGGISDQLEVLQNRELQTYRLQMFDQKENEEQEQVFEEIKDLDLRRRIEDYNRVTKDMKREKERNRRSRRKEAEGKSRRKVRTTITIAKLEEMNRIFKQYLQVREKSKEARNYDQIKEEDEGSLEMESLKTIGERLGLGYSTILHKFREFRATKKVKGGALIAALNQKRKYKKSKEIEELIDSALKEGSFFTAVELSKYIQNKFNRKLSRSIISRHLGEMGYSYKNTKPKPANKNTPQLKQMRKKFATAVTFLRNSQANQTYYIDEYVFSLNDVPRRNIDFDDQSEIEEHLNLTILASSGGIVKFQVQESPMMSFQFKEFMEESIECLERDGNKGQPKLIVLDMENQVHYCDEVLLLRQREMLEKNIKLFYLPPSSNQMNLLEWLLPTIKNHLMTMEFGSLQELKKTLEDFMTQLHYQNLNTFFKEVEYNERKGLTFQNFE